jgi:hypothetical protein
MSYEPRIGPDGRDDPLTRALRDVYAPPRDEAYWSTLTQRIMARVDQERELEPWWQPLAAWARVGVVAACLAVTAAGVLASRNRPAQVRLAYKAVIDFESDASPKVTIVPSGDPIYGGTLLYVPSP